MDRREIISIGQKLADAGIVKKYPARSHSHDIFSLFPQTEAQFKWLKKRCGTTRNLMLIYTAEEVLNVAPELKGYITKSKSGRFCRIIISLVDL